MLRGLGLYLKWDEEVPPGRCNPAAFLLSERQPQP